jgi:hypothetical protein
MFLPFLRRHRALLVLAVAAYVGAVAALVYLSNRPTADGITWENLSRVRAGMTRQGVVDVFGLTPGNYRDQGESGGSVQEFVTEKKAGASFWLGKHATVMIEFDSQGRAVRKSYAENPSPFRLLVTRVRARLGGPPATVGKLVPVGPLGFKGRAPHAALGLLPRSDRCGSVTWRAS